MTKTKKKLNKYKCVSCNETFTLKQGKKPRCPHCMSIHSVEPLEEKDSIQVPPWSKWVAIGLGVVIVAVAGYYGFMHFRTTASPVITDPTTIGALTSDTLKKYLGDEGLEDDNVIDPFVSNETLDTFVDTKKGFGGHKKRADAIYAAFIELKGDGKYKPRTPHQPRKDPIMTPGELFGAIEAGDAPKTYSLELALLFVAAARHAGLAAVVVEVVDYPGLRAPLDPSGNFGHFAVAVYDAGAYEGSFTVYDLHQARTQPGAETETIALTDPQVVAHVLGHEAVRLVAVEFNGQEAMLKLEDAFILAPDTVQFHTMQALIFATAGGIDEGTEELRKAMQIRTDAQRLVKWGSLLMADDEEEQAMEEIQKAIDMKPDYALAHATLAMTLLADGQTDEGERELNLAKELDPSDPIIAIYETNYWMAKGDVLKAMRSAESAWEKNYHDPQTGLLLAAIYAKAGKVEKMRTILQEIRQYEDLPQEIADLIDAQLGGMSVELDVDDDGEDDEDFEEDPNIAALLEEDDEEDVDDGDNPSLDKPTLGGKPSEGFLTGGGGGGGLGLNPGGGGSGLSLKPGGGMLSGGN